jgi:hypothetical protein
MAVLFGSAPRIVTMSSGARCRTKVRQRVLDLEKYSMWRRQGVPGSRPGLGYRYSATVLSVFWPESQPRP